ncbi:MAG: hypothetical protein M3179_00515 [Actinomycetota bacterium]|nr:hypothetical protein [Actinomycetota bacterium]
MGDELDLVLLSGPERPPAAGEATAADGEVVQATIVGVGVLANQVVPVSDLDASPRIVAPPAFAQRYAPDQDDWCYDLALFTLAPGTDVDRIIAETNRISGPGGIALIQDLTSSYAEVRRTIQPQVTALWLFAAAAAAATLLVVAQLLGRQLHQSTAAAALVWRALGLTGSQVRTLIAAPSLVTALVGGGVAWGGAVALSSRFPIGPARLAETDRGVELHAWIHLGGALVVVAAALAIGAAAAFVLRSGARSAPLGLLARIRGATAQPAVVVGIHLAADSGGGEAAVPVRSAALGASVAIAAVIATVTFAAGLNDLVSESARYGRDWDVMVDGVFAPTPVAKVLQELGENSSVWA